jgi:hypothetical protein
MDKPMPEAEKTPGTIAAYVVVGEEYFWSLA